ncbi:coagulation factor XI-like [Pleurodeles waltl]|uniref:coagulation factor XI-like n=1 Tax=Pleurodeles waltl TaxID=8319 RepID=UPI0037095B57
MQIPGARYGFLVFLLGTIAGELLQHTDLPGHDLKKVWAPDAEYCQLICTYHPLCSAFTFTTADLNPGLPRYSCFLKTNLTSNPTATAHLQNATSGNTLPKNPENLQRCYPKIFPETDFPGSDLINFSVDDVTACQDACSRNPYCQFFTYNDDNRWCFLKWTTMLASPDILEQAGINSGFSQRDCCSGNDCDKECANMIIPNIDFEGTFVAEFGGYNLSSCQLACTRDRHCHFFTFYTDQFALNSKRLMCYLRKSNLGVPTGSPFLANVLSGFTKKSSKFQKSEKECADFLLPNVNFEGNKIGSILASNEAHCQRLCTQHPQCQFFTFYTERWSSDNQKLTCLLKSSDKKIPENVTPLEDVISGFSLTASALQKSNAECANLLFQNIVFYEKVVEQIQGTDVTACHVRCTNNPECEFFSFESVSRC